MTTLSIILGCILLIGVGILIHSQADDKKPRSDRRLMGIIGCLIGAAFGLYSGHRDLLKANERANYGMPREPSLMEPGDVYRTVHRQDFGKWVYLLLTRDGDDGRVRLYAFSEKHPPPSTTCFVVVRPGRETRPIACPAENSAQAPP